jgi:hypothetical protein
LEIPVLLCKPVFTNRDGSTGEMYLVSNNLELSKDTLVWKEGMNNWLAAGTIPELSGLFITVAQTGWKKYLMWAAIVIGVIIVYSAIVGDDKGSTVERTYIYEDLAASIYTLVLNEDNTAVLTEDGKYRKASYKGSWERLRLKINNAPIIAIRYSNGGSQYIREDYIYETFDAMEAKDDKYGFKITRQ